MRCSSFEHSRSRYYCNHAEGYTKAGAFWGNDRGSISAILSANSANI